jgi:putative ABC transport system permease protein
MSSQPISKQADEATFDQSNRFQALLYAFQECVRSALSSIRAHGLRSFLTMLGIIIGVASVICVIALLQGLTQSVMGELQGLGGNTLIVQADTPWEDRLRGKINYLRQSDLDEIRFRIDGISNLTSMVYPRFSGGVRNGANTASTAQVVATTPYYQLVNQIYPHYGRFVTQSDNDTSRRVAVLGEKVRTDLRLPDNPVGSYIQLGSEWFKVVGLMESKGEMFGRSQDDYLVIPYQTGLSLSGSSTQPDISMTLTVNDMETLDSTVARVTALLRRLHKLDKGQADDFNVRSSQSVAQTISRISTTITIVVSAIVGISLLVGGVGIMNIMLVSVTERTREIGIAKALGAPRKYILMQFLIEAMVLAVIGGMVGILIGFLLSFIPTATIPNFPPPAVPWWAVFGATGFSAMVGMLFGFLPARKAANLAPIDALRHE